MTNGQWRPRWLGFLKSSGRLELTGMIVLMLVMPLFQIGLETICRWIHPFLGN